MDGVIQDVPLGTHGSFIDANFTNVCLSNKVEMTSITEKSYCLMVQVVNDVDH